MKARLLAVLLVSTLVLASATTVALGQEAEGEGRDGDVTIVDCSQVQNAFVRGQHGNANASAQYDSDAVAVVAQELNISQDQVNSCLVNVGGDGDGNGDGDGDTDATDTDDENDVMAKTIPEVDELPETGVSSLLALGAGVALVAGAASLILSRR